jgi:hypothetical protein
MTKRYILTAGDNYYPERGTGDWIASFHTREEAEEQVTKEVTISKPLTLNLLGEPYTETNYIINGHKFDWYQIIDLSRWL